MHPTGLPQAMYVREQTPGALLCIIVCDIPVCTRRTRLAHYQRLENRCSESSDKSTVISSRLEPNRITTNIKYKLYGAELLAHLAH